MHDKRFSDVYAYLKQRKFTPKLHVLDKKCSKEVENYIQNNQTTMQLVKPHRHRVNAAERAIQTFKNHFISGLCTVNHKFPLQLWCDLLPQAQLTLNLLHQARCINKLSAHAILEGEYNYNKTPIAPPGTKALVFQNPKSCASWAPHAKDAWYIGPTLSHYRCYKFWVPETKGYVTAQTASFFQHIVLFPQ